MKKTKPFTIGKLQVMNAYNKVKANKGSGGVHQMSSGSYISCAVKLAEYFVQMTKY